MIGDTFGPYRVLNKIGEGGMGVVYRATDTRLNRQVALKVLPATLAADAERLRRFRREAQILASLQHPNIAGIHGIEEGESTSALVLELVEGPTLAEQLRGGPMAIDEALRLAVQIARALEAAHQREVVHRDLKPGNLKRAPNGDVKVLDFGLAKALDSPAQDEIPGTENPTATTTVLTQSGAIMGTAAYMSPEQARGRPVDERCDIWSFGCVLFEMLTGGRAFPGATVSDTIVAVLTREPDWDALPAAVPQEVRRLLRRALAKNHDQRLHHMADARIELEETLQAMTSGPVLGAPSDSSRVASDAEQSHAPFGTRAPARKRTAAGLGLVLAVAAAAALWHLPTDPGRPTAVDRSIAVLPFETIGSNQATAFTDGVHGDVLTRLSQLSDLRVVSKTSVMRYRSSTLSLPAIARELQVTWVLGADVQEAGDQVQVNARLMHAQRDEQVWAESYRRDLTAENLFQIQADVTERVVAELQAQLSPQERRAVARVPTGDLDAYRLYVRGRALLEQRTPESMGRAVDYFQRALDRDSGYALAWAGLGDALVLMRWYGYAPPDTGFGPEDAVERALALNAELGEAHAALGLLHAYRLEGPEAVRALERAVELQPSYVQAQGWLCFVYLLVGRPADALEVANHTTGLQPPPETLAELAEAYLANGATEQALAQARRAQQLQPGYALAGFLEGLALYQLGRHEEAEPVLKDAAVAFVSPGHLATVALAQIARGDDRAARDTMEVVDASTGSPFWIGLVRAGLGDIDAAFDAFHRVDRWSDWPTLPFRYYYPGVLGALRHDPRYRTLLRDVYRSWGLQADGGFPDGQ